MRPRLTRPIAEIHSPRRVQEARPRVLCALRNVRRQPGAEPCRRKPEGCWTALPLRGRSPGQPALPPPQRIAGSYTSFQPLRVRPRPSLQGVAGNSPVYSHGCKSPLPVADGVAGNSGCTTSGRPHYSRYPSHHQTGAPEGNYAGSLGPATSGVPPQARG